MKQATPKTVCSKCAQRSIPVVTPPTPPPHGGPLGSVTIGPSLALSYQIVATNGAYQYSQSGLPTGLSLNISTGLITGTITSTTLTSYTVTIRARNIVGWSAPMTLTIIVKSYLAFKFNAPSDGVASFTPYAQISLDGAAAFTANTTDTYVSYYQAVVSHNTSHLLPATSGSFGQLFTVIGKGDNVTLLPTSQFNGSSSDTFSAGAQGELQLKLFADSGGDPTGMSQYQSGILNSSTSPLTWASAATVNVTLTQDRVFDCYAQAGRTIAGATITIAATQTFNFI